MDNLIALLTLTGMEIVLGIDNLIFIAILVGKLPERRREKARKLGIGLALAMRIALLFSISWIMSLKDPLFSAMGRVFTGRELILLAGGLFLIGKATFEIHEKLESGADASAHGHAKGSGRFLAVLVQIMFLDIIFSLDSVITAVGMMDNIKLMVIAMVLSVCVMLFAARGVGAFVEKHPTIKILALSFLIMIGVMLTMEGMGNHINKGYIYFAMAFSLGVELLNLKIRKQSNPVHLKR